MEMVLMNSMAMAIPLGEGVHFDYMIIKEVGGKPADPKPNGGFAN